MFPDNAISLSSGAFVGCVILNAKWNKNFFLFTAV